MFHPGCKPHLFRALPCRPVVLIPCPLPPPARALDGEATRANIIEAAGRLFAERGYAETTSKAICERAQTNIAAVNYYFGSRDELYLTLLREVHKRVMSMRFLREIAGSSMSAEDKLGVFLEGLVSAIVDSSSWHTRLWAREILTPSPLLSQVMREEAMPKFQVLSGIVGEITGLRPARPRWPVAC